MSFAALAAPLAIGSSLMQGVSAIQAGNAAKAQAQARQQELEQEANVQQTNATQQQADRLRNLNQTVGAIRALSAQRNLSLDSPSSAAVVNNVENQATRDTRNIAFNAIQQSASLKLAGAAALASGKAYQNAGYIKAGQSLFQAGKDAASAYG